jgi:tetratricopeptide (TPR) repeat protein
MKDEVEARQLASFQEALALGYGGQQRRAIDMLETLLQEAPDNEDKGWFLMFQVTFLAQVERTAEARELLRKLTRLWEDTREHRARMAAADAMLDEAGGQASLSLEKYNHILKQYRSLWSSEDVRDLYEEIQISRGRILATTGKWRLALPVLEESLQFERPKAGEFYCNLGSCYYHAEKWEKAEEALKLALSKEMVKRFSSAAHYYLGYLLRRKGAVAKAFKEFEVALSDAKEASSSCKPIYDALARTSKELGLDEQSAEYSRLSKTSK